MQSSNFRKIRTPKQTYEIVTFILCLLPFKAFFEPQYT